MGFFGTNSPLRLLREDWRNPKMLAQELYSMFTSREPAVREGPVEIRVPRNETGLTITQGERSSEASDPGNSMTPGRARQASVPERPRFEADRSESRRDYFEPSSDLGRPSGRSEPGGQFGPGQYAGSSNYEPPRSQEPGRYEPPHSSFRPYASPALAVRGPISFSGPPVQFERPPVVFNPRMGGYEAYFQPTLISGGGSTAIFGEVVDGEGATWSVKIPDEDSESEDATKTVDVEIPYIDEDEQAPVGIKIGPIFTDTDDAGETIYKYQPPTWLP